MGKIAFILACLNIATHGPQAVACRELLQRDRESIWHATRKRRSKPRASAKADANPLKALALFFENSHCAAAFRPASLGMRFSIQYPSCILSPSGQGIPLMRIGGKLKPSEQAPTIEGDCWTPLSTRGKFLRAAISALTATHIVWPSAVRAADEPPRAYLAELAGKNYGKSEMGGEYSDFTRTRAGLYYKDRKVGGGQSPQQQDRVVLEWTGYTIGFRGVPFETRKLRSLDSVSEDDALLRFVVGQGKVITALEQGVQGMLEGGVRQLVVPYGDLSYPESDPTHEKVGPKPSTFSGYQALNFALLNKGLIDKTLLFNIKLVRVDKPDGKGGFIAGKSFS